MEINKKASKSMNSPRLFNQFTNQGNSNPNNQILTPNTNNNSSNNSKIHQEKELNNILGIKDKNQPVKLISSSSSSKSKRNNDTPIYEKLSEEKIKELLDKNEKLEKECIKYKIQLKTMENKIQENTEKNYKALTNTSSRFILPSEFKTMWEAIANENMIDTFIDFFDNQAFVFHLIQDFFLLNIQHFKVFFKSKIEKICLNLKIPFNKNNLPNIFKHFKGLIEEFFENIFHDPDELEPYLDTLKQSILQKINLYKTKVDFDDQVVEDVNSALNSKYFKEFVSVMKKIILYCEMHEPQLSFKILEFENRLPEIRNFKPNEILCVDGLPRENKPCLILIDPPSLKSNYAYMGLKPIVVVYKKGGFSTEDEKIFLNKKE